MRDVRAEFEQIKKNKVADAKKKKDDKKTATGAVQSLPEVISYLPYKCGKEYLDCAIERFKFQSVIENHF